MTSKVVLCQAISIGVGQHAFQASQVPGVWKAHALDFLKKNMIDINTFQKTYVVACHPSCQVRMHPGHPDIPGPNDMREKL